MDEIQELLKIFYKFFVGARNKPRPTNEENQPKYYKNKYYQPNTYSQHLLSEKRPHAQAQEIRKYTRKTTNKILKDMDQDDYMMTEDELVMKKNDTFHPLINESVESNHLMEGHDSEEKEMDFDKIVQDSQKPDSLEKGKEEGGGGEKVRVTIPIDWDEIIEKHIKNTNTNVIEQKISNESESDD